MYAQAGAAMPRPSLYTIGYAPHSPEELIAILRLYGVTAVADVRSSPWSSYRREFGKKRLERWLSDAGIEYVWLGDSLGPRYEDESVMVDGRADYERIAGHPRFKAGLERLSAGMERFTVALMCAEKDPLACHRAVLVARNMKTRADISHILADASLETQDGLERRLMALYLRDQAELPGVSTPPSLDEAYRRRGGEMAWRGK
jgi:uncharacterized protein (DUF488 family)